MTKMVTSSKLAKLLRVEAITIYPTIYFRMTEPSDDLVVHEMVHIEQQKRDGLFKFVVRYFKEYLLGLKNGLSDYDAYRNISYEKEAFKAQNDFLRSKNKQG